MADVKVADVRDLAAVTAAIMPVICSKQYGHEKILAEAIASACLYTLPPEPATPRIDVDNIRTARLLGGSVDQTKMMAGMVLMNLPQTTCCTWRTRRCWCSRAGWRRPPRRRRAPC